MAKKKSIRITGEERKKQLMGVGLKLFLEKGFDDTAVDDIVREAGVAKGTFYIYFASKEELFGELYLMIVQGAIDAVAEVMNTDKKAWEKFEDLLNVPTQTLIEFGDFLVLFHRSSTDIEIARRKFEINRRLLGYMVDLIEQGIEEGTMEVDNPELTAYLAMELIWEAERYTLVLDEPRPHDDLPPYYIDLIRRLLRAGKPSVKEVIGHPLFE